MKIFFRLARLVRSNLMRISQSIKNFTPDHFTLQYMHDILKRKLFQNPSSILVRVASSDVGTRPKSGGLGNMVELKVTLTIRFAVQLFSLVVSLLPRHCRHPKGAISVHIRSCFSFASLKLYWDGRVFRNTKAETLGAL